MGKQVLMLLTNCFDPDPRVYTEAQTLVEHGYRVTVLGWDRDRKKPPRERFDGIQVERIFLSSRHGRGSSQVPFLIGFWVLALLRNLRRRYDIIHCHDLDTLPLGMLLGRLWGARVIFDAHESFPDMLAGNVGTNLKDLLKRLEDFLIRRVDAVITVGQLLGREYQRRGSERTYVVGNWKRIGDFEPLRERAHRERQRLGVPQTALVITYIAWLSEERRLPALLEVLDDDDGLFLIIGGEGPLREEIRRRAEISSNIHYLGPVPPDQVPLYTTMADIIYYGFDEAHPNARYSAPNKLFEALAAGKAVVTGQFGEIGRIVAQERCGLALSVLTAEGLAAAFARLRDRKLLETFQFNALRAGRERYNWARAAKELLRAYGDLMTGGSGRRPSRAK
jgi:glycosyltransferase involved in cell wall biosynthesis